jgi:hypothetical protein
MVVTSMTYAALTVQSVPTDNTAAYWTFDGSNIDWNGNTLFDVSSNARNGTLVFMDQSSNQTIGKRGQALIFDGDIESISLSANPLSSVASPSSACAWARSDDVTVASGGWSQTFLNLYTDASNGVRLGSVTNSGNLFVSYRSGGTYYGAQSVSSVFSNGVWKYVCYVWDGSGITLYANGVSVSTTTNSDSIGLVNTIGARDNLADGTWKGALDDLRIYSRALTAAEIRRMYVSGVATVKTSIGHTLTAQASASGFISTGLIGHWSFDGKYMNWRTNQVLDSSGNGNHATVVNMSTTTSPRMGRSGQALDFDSVDDRVALSSELVGTGPVTVSAWVHPRTSGGSDAGIIVSNRRFKVTVDSTPFRFFASNGTGNTGSGVVSSLFSSWTHIVVTRDAGGLINFYVNGALSGTPDQDGGTPLAGVSPLNIGNSALNESPFDGLIDEVRLYNRILSVSEIRQLYNRDR